MSSQSAKDDREARYPRVQCPYRACTFTGTEDEVDDHRATGVHDDEAQAGSNLRR